MARSDGKWSDDTTQVLPSSKKSFTPRPSESIAQFLVVADGPESGKQVELTLTAITIGRAHDNQLVLADPCVSSHHCSIVFDHGQVCVLDCGSTNGSFIDDQPVTGRVEWPIESLLRVGNQRLRREYRPRQAARDEATLTEDLRRASRYVQSLLPPALQKGPVKTSWAFSPSTALGGDILDCFWLDPEHFVFYLLDVCGHGVGAALHSVSVLHLLRQQSLPNTDFRRPAEVLTALNRSMPMERYGDMYFTAWYGVYRPRDRRLRFASAGHPPALTFDSQGNFLSCPESSAPPVGVLAESIYHDTETVLPPESLIYLYSDGIYEFAQPSGEFWSREGFAELLQKQLKAGLGQPELVLGEVQNLAGTGQLEDDVSLFRFGN